MLLHFYTHLARRLDALEHSETDNNPGENKTASDDQVKLSYLTDGVCYIQSFTEPEV